MNEALTGVLSRACSLEGQLRTASQAYTKLNEVKSDAQTACHMVETTAVLARDVSAKVRQLDLARVSSVQKHKHFILKVCNLNFTLKDSVLVLSDQKFRSAIL